VSTLVGEEVFTFEGDGTGFVCPLCGGRFTHGDRVCGCCPMSSGCDVVRCPHCRYQFPRSSRIVDFLSGLLTRRKEPR
jgi:hypothetical protein